ncbi:YbhB/YbcL family Raf kinase inhibitor-like protein [Aquifex sp.]
MNRVLGFFLGLGLISMGGVLMKVFSPAFEYGDVIPSKYTCEGEDISPPVRWEGAPEGTKSFVLIMDDPDAPLGTFTHWIVYDIPADVNELYENFPKTAEVKGIKQGINDFGRVGYGGPCPPKGHGYHRYFFRIYALDISSLGLPPEATREQVESKIKGHILGSGELMGRYKRD